MSLYVVEEPGVRWIYSGPRSLDDEAIARAKELGLKESHLRCTCGSFCHTVSRRRVQRQRDRSYAAARRLKAGL